MTERVLKEKLDKLQSEKDWLAKDLQLANEHANKRQTELIRVKEELEALKKDSNKEELITGLRFQVREKDGVIEKLNRELQDVQSQLSLTKSKLSAADDKCRSLEADIKKATEQTAQQKELY